MAANMPGAIKRVAREADGWIPVGIPITAVGQMFDGMKAMAKEFGRDPTALELLVRANVEISTAPIDKDRADFTGTVGQIAEDIAATRKIGANEIVFDVQFSPRVHTVEDILAGMEQLREIAGRS
jgi:alkanesulfonate monooxygenase SsuD/methylene tetrahydromethanopterin reductase-like flavin-dependent oxidoreductase (luciferase family)